MNEENGDIGEVPREYHVSAKMCCFVVQSS